MKPQSTQRGNRILFNTEERHVRQAWKLIQYVSIKLRPDSNK